LACGIDEVVASSRLAQAIKVPFHEGWKKQDCWAIRLLCW
jgi:hypothetical protein